MKLGILAIHDATKS